MDIFFYGLFMDTSILEKNGLRPSNPRKGWLHDYALKIGNRASLIPSAGQKSYGMVMTVDDEAAQKLYRAPSVADYIPEEVQVVTDADETITTICYNLPAESLTGTNTAYAKSLLQLAEKLDFPHHYLAHIKQMT
ncbi:gamma-glutamylcyclotransferase family protein [Ekhidna sp.]|uniref:gamma-glutamylcyclotransferase family protein n=1 Tax=Ekhidna sp. TaxID=2608089 RepID=UPI0032984E8B